MKKKLKAIVLHTLKYTESSLIVHAFTEQEGRMAFWVRVAKSKKSLVKSVLFQPLSVLEMEVDIPTRGGLAYIKEVENVSPFLSIPYDSVKLSVALFLAEFLSMTLREEAENRPMFAYLCHSIAWLDGAQKGISNFHLVFLLRFSRFLGLYPNTDGYVHGALFDLQSGCFTQSMPLHNQVVSATESIHLRLLIRMNYETMHLFRFTRAERLRCLEVILLYYSIHVPEFKEMKSLAVLTELFD